MLILLGEDMNKRRKITLMTAFVMLVSSGIGYTLCKKKHQEYQNNRYLHNIGFCNHNSHKFPQQKTLAQL